MSSHYGHLQQIKYKLIIIVTMLECKTVTLRTRPLKNGMLSYYLDYYPGYRDQETMKTIRHEAFIFMPIPRMSANVTSMPLCLKRQKPSDVDALNLS